MKKDFLTELQDRIASLEHDKRDLKAEMERLTVALDNMTIDRDHQKARAERYHDEREGSRDEVEALKIKVVKMGKMLDLCSVAHEHNVRLKKELDVARATIAMAEGK